MFKPYIYKYIHIYDTCYGKSLILPRALFEKGAKYTVAYKVYINLLKTLYLKAPNESHSCVLLFNVLYNIAPLYRNDLLTHISLLGT